MARVLFVVPPLVGHVNPTISVASALAARGHEVAWVGHPGAVRPLLPDGARLYPLPEQAPAGSVERALDRAHTLRGPARLKFLWEDFLVPLARTMRPGVEAAVTEHAPAVMAVDQQAVAGALVARRRGVPWATLATTSAGVIDPLAGLPQVKAWLAGLVAALEREAGLEPSPDGELSPHRVIAFTTEALVGATDRFGAHYRFVGPSIGDRPETAAFPWDALDPDRPHVLVSMGTVNAEASGRFFATAIEALSGQGYQVIVAAPVDLVGAPPDDVSVRARVPQLALLPHVHAVVCHAGHNTVCEALAHGVPLVVAPIKDDQPIVADQVVAAGCAVRVKFGRVQPAELRAAVARVLTEPAFRAAAAQVQTSFAAAGGAAAAATALEELL